MPWTSSIKMATSSHEPETDSIHLSGSYHASDFVLVGDHNGGTELLYQPTITITALTSRKGLTDVNLMVLVGGLPTVGDLTWIVGEALAVLRPRAPILRALLCLEGPQ